MIHWLLSKIPANWWGFWLWRYLNPVHFVIAFAATALHGPLAIRFWTGQLIWFVAVGFTHELADGDLAKGWEGIKDMYSFNVGSLLYYACIQEFK